MDKIRCLDLGCGKQITKHQKIKIDEYYGVDIVDSDLPNVKKSDLFVERIPFENEMFNYVIALDFMEHVPRVLYYKDKLIYPFIHVMNEVYRVLKKDGVFIIKSPSFESSSSFFYSDPTHVNPISEYTFQPYFCTSKDSTPSEPWAKQYGFVGNFEIIEREEIKNEKIKHNDECIFSDCFFSLRKI